MDRMRDLMSDPEGMGVVEHGVDTAPVIGTDERRMHVRAYNHWASLLEGRAYPSVEDIRPDGNDDFGPHAVLLDFTGGVQAPAIAWLGPKLRAECGLPGEVDDIAAVPSRSLLSRLTDHYLQIIANRAPIGFEAEFTNVRGHNTLYRGILMPLSSDGVSIDFIYGVINWKELVGRDIFTAIESEIAAVVLPQPSRAPLTAWADGPSGRIVSPIALAPQSDGSADEYGSDDSKLMSSAPTEHAGLAEWLAAARSSTGVFKYADGRGRAALYQALGHAYDFALLARRRTAEYRDLLAQAGMAAQARAPMTPVVKLVFGADHDKTRLTEFAAALSYAMRHALPPGGMRHFLDQYPGGLKAVVATERRERRPTVRQAKPDLTREAARGLETQAILTLPGDDEFMVLVARRLDGNRVGVIGVAEGSGPFLDRALKAVVAA